MTKRQREKLNRIAARCEKIVRDSVRAMLANPPPSREGAPAWAEAECTRMRTRLTGAFAGLIDIPVGKEWLRGHLQPLLLQASVEALCNSTTEENVREYARRIEELASNDPADKWAGDTVRLIEAELERRGNLAKEPSVPGAEPHDALSEKR